ncbi:O-antigen ligase family protein [Actinomycetospora termitidis]|uniref:Uncharacterized protein n=1 Tax=Actinomycetospora termitidis TaxID=3053470 RepID=A0ABT7ME83_9PSEU|nr:O-antigen ligase family protein [Actinomycetospora sp. Odt1-22]MDL5158978.1 hypothetical protein [Actinomycetospora sp. Odt1-22]
MAMYAGFSYFMAVRIGWTSFWLRLVLVVGLLGTLSTGGFAVFVVVVVVQYVVSKRHQNAATLYIGIFSGSVAIGLAVWVAVSAPGLGLDAKQDVNASSLSERNDATSAGLNAIVEHPFGGGSAQNVGGVNLVASVAVYGIPFVVLICLAFAWSLIVVKRGSSSGDVGAILVLFLTLATSQPPAGATWVFVSLMVVATRLDGCPRGAPARYLAVPERGVA